MERSIDEANSLVPDGRADTFGQEIAGIIDDIGIVEIIEQKFSPSATEKK